MSEDRWLLPKLGPPAIAQVALEQVRFVLEERPVPTSTSSDVAATFTDQAGDVADLVELVSTLVNLAAVLACVAGGSSASGVALLDVVAAHQRARVDLASLDDGNPFGTDEAS